MRIRPVNALAVILTAFSWPVPSMGTKSMKRKDYRNCMAMVSVMVLAENDGKK